MLAYRFKIFGTHLFFSICILSIFLIVIFFIWFPYPLSKALGVGQIVGMMILIDIILGPLLTFIIANKNKKSLKLDLLFIIIVQISALIYGVHSIAKSRPVFIAFDTIRFEVVQANNIPEKLLSESPRTYKKLDFFGPQYVTIKPAQNDQEKNKRLFRELQYGITPSMQPNLYHKLNKSDKLIQKNAIAFDYLKKYNSLEKIRKVTIKYPQANAWLPLKASSVDMVVLINKEKAEVVKIVDLRPWN